MREFSWAFRFILLLFRQSYLMVFLLAIQVFITVGTSQGQDMLRAMMTEEGFVFQCLVYESGIIFSGVLYFIGGYWLLFFSNIKGRLYDEPENYKDTVLKLRAWRYHDFLIHYRSWLIRTYTGFLLFSPFLTQVASMWVMGVFSWRWAFFCLFTLLVNIWIVALRKSRKGLGIQVFQLIFRAIDQFFVSLGSKIGRIKGFIVPVWSDPPKEPVWKPEYMTSEHRVHTIKQAFPAYRGAFYLLIVAGFALWFALLFLPASWLQQMGSLSVLQLGLCIWVVAVIWVGYLNKVYAFPIRIGLVAWILVCSSINSDHPLRTRDEKTPVIPAPPMEQVLDQWLESRPGFVKGKPVDSLQVDSVQYSKSCPFAVVIVCAEGGASRSAYWSAKMMESLRNRLGPKLDDHLFAISSVSGGSMGILAYSTVRQYYPAEMSGEKLDRFFATDFLSPLTNRLVAGEVFHWLTPFYDPFFDRATAFEKSIDEAIAAQLLPEGETLPTLSALSDSKKTLAYKPLLLINSVEVESGKRSILSGRPVSKNGFQHVVDLNAAITKPLEISGAMHIGARFPVFSPSAAITNKQGITRHYIDGGYYDNVGYETASEVVLALKKSKYASCIRPVVLSIINSNENAESLVKTSDYESIESVSNRRSYWDGAYFLNEPMSVFTGVSKIRSANTETHRLQLRKILAEMNQDLKQPTAYTFDLNATEDEIPMNWSLTPSAIKHMNQRVKRVLQQIDSNSVFRNPVNLCQDVQPKAVADIASVATPNNLSSPDSVAPLPGSVAQRPILKSQNPTPKPVGKNETPTPAKKKTNISPSTTPYLYYWSVKRKKWVLKSEAGMGTLKLKPLRRKGAG